MVSRNFHLQKPEKDQRASKSKTQYNSRLTEESRVPQQKNITLQQPTNHNNSQQPKSEFLSHRFSAIENNRMHSAMDTSKQSHYNSPDKGAARGLSTPNHFDFANNKTFLKTFRDDVHYESVKRSQKSWNSLSEKRLKVLHGQKNIKQYLWNQEVLKTMSKNNSFIQRKESYPFDQVMVLHNK